MEKKIHAGDSRIEENNSQLRTIPRVEYLYLLEKLERKWTTAL